MKVQLRVSDVEVVMNMSLEEARLLREVMGKSPWRADTQPIYLALDRIVVQATELVGN